MKKCLRNLYNQFEPPKLIYKELVKNALIEDLGHGDITTDLTIAPDQQGTAKIIAKEEGVCAGLFVVKEVFKQVDKEIFFDALVNDGDTFKKKDVLVHLEGRLKSILLGERVALNFFQRLCGIATLTKKACDKIKDLPARLVCTRKTTPGLRILEKYAVRVGGAHNHRFNLSDGILIKDNHIAACGSIRRAIEQAKANATHILKIEVEVSSLEELEEALDAGADAVLLDNMDYNTLKKAVKLTKTKRPEVIIEASGGVGLDNIREFALTGVDIISSGQLTHSYKSIDLSLKVHILKK